jgi:hypothetical protein
MTNYKLQTTNFKKDEAKDEKGDVREWSLEVVDVRSLTCRRFAIEVLAVSYFLKFAVCSLKLRVEAKR